jgi:hypothetical protein
MNPLYFPYVLFLFIWTVNGYRQDLSIQQKIYGEWIVWHSTQTHEFMNREVVHLYPDNKISICHRYSKGPFVFHKEKVGQYFIDDKGTFVKVNLNLNSYKDNLLSIYGVGTENFPVQEKPLNIRLCLKLYCVGTDDLYLSNPYTNHCFHLVKSVRINEPKIDVPLSTFIFTQILGLFFTQILHILFMHNNLY